MLSCISMMPTWLKGDLHFESIPCAYAYLLFKKILKIQSNAVETCIRYGASLKFQQQQKIHLITEPFLFIIWSTFFHYQEPLCNRKVWWTLQVLSTDRNSCRTNKFVVPTVNKRFLSATCNSSMRMKNTQFDKHLVLQLIIHPSSSQLNDCVWLQSLHNNYLPNNCRLFTIPSAIAQWII